MKEKGLAYMTWIAILGGLIVAVVAMAGLLLILETQAGKAEDEIVKTKTSIDYSDSYTKLAARVSLQPAIYDNGQAGGFAKLADAPCGYEEGTGDGGTVYWKAGDRTDCTPSQDTIVGNISEGSKDRFKGYLEEGGFEVLDSALRLETDGERIGGTFYVEAREEGETASVSTQKSRELWTDEEIETTYRLLPEIGKVITENSEGLIDSRVHEAVEEANDHYQESRNSCDEDNPDATCPADNPIEPNVDETVASKMDSLETSIEEEVGHDVEIEMEPVLVAKQVEEVRKAREVGEGTYYVSSVFFIHGGFIDAARDAWNAITGGGTETTQDDTTGGGTGGTTEEGTGEETTSGEGTTEGETTTETSTSTTTEVNCPEANDPSRPSGAETMTLEGTEDSDTFGDHTIELNWVQIESGCKTADLDIDPGTDNPDNVELIRGETVEVKGMQITAEEVECDETSFSGCDNPHGQDSVTLYIVEERECTYCKEAHWDIAYRYEYAMKVRVRDGASEIHTADGLKKPEVVFLLEGMEVVDNECGDDDHTCKDGFGSSTSAPSTTNPEDLDWPEPGDIEEENRGSVPEENGDDTVVSDTGDGGGAPSAGPGALP